MKLRLHGLPIGMMRKSSPKEPKERLLRRMARDGYLYVPALLPPRLPLAARAEAEKRGPGVVTVTDDFKACARLAASPPLRRLIRGLIGPFGRHPLPYSRQSRVYKPGKYSDPHQDMAVIESWTVWVPAGDIPVKLGGLTVMPGSHLLGLMSHAANHLIELPNWPGCHWLTADFRAGDVVVFHSHTVHASLPNRTRNELRYSIDMRFCPMKALRGFKRPASR